MSSFFIRCQLVLAILCLGAVARGDVLANYDFTGSPGSQAFEAADFQDPFISAGNIVRGGGLNSAAGANTINSNFWFGGIGRLSYYEFTITPIGGAEMTLTNLSYADRRSATGPTTFDVTTSLDGVNFTTQLLYNEVTAGSDIDRSIPLAGLANLTTTVTFRIFGWSSTNAGGQNALLNHSTTGGLTVEGTLFVVPEPASSGVLLALGALGLVMRRRKR
ncbi:MAG: PEP-CTERM sorting domain-containing protein [Pirellulaceae bacterium]